MGSVSSSMLPEAKALLFQASQYGRFLKPLGKQLSSCHSERSEEFLLDFKQTKKPGGILRSAQNDNVFFSAACQAVATKIVHETARPVEAPLDPSHKNTRTLHFISVKDIPVFARHR
jgi:hypothetical protein